MTTLTHLQRLESESIHITVRQLFPKGEFVEIFIDTPIEVAETRDQKGLYEQARRGDLKNFTGIDSAYEPPEAPEIRIDTTRLSAEEAAEAIIESLSMWLLSGSAFVPA